MATKQTAKKDNGKKAAAKKAPTKKANGKKAKRIPRPRKGMTKAELDAAAKGDNVVPIGSAKKGKKDAAKKDDAKKGDEPGAAPAQMYEKMAENAPVMSVPFKDLGPDFDFNVRKNYEQIEELARDISQLGLISPLVVRRIEKPGKNGARFLLLAGYRRYHAIMKLREEAAAMKKKTGDDKAFAAPFESIQVKVLECTELQAHIVNIRENLSRSDLTLWDLGDKCALLQERFDVSARVIGDMLSYDRKTVSNAQRVVTNVATDIQVQFRDPDLKVKPTQQVLLEMAGMRKEDGSPDHEAQRAAWDEYIGNKAPGGNSSDGDSGDGDGDSNPQLGGKMMTLKKAKQVLAGLEAARKAAREDNPDKEDFLRGCLAATKYMMSLNKSITGVRLGMAD